MATARRPAIYVVDPDQEARKMVTAAAEAVGAKTRCFRSAGEFLDFYHRDLTGCLLISVWLPDMSGEALQERLLEQYCTLPMIFVGTGSTVAQAVRVLRRGAIDFLEKPLRPEDLREALGAALELAEQYRVRHAELTEHAERFGLLTSREREVLDAVVSGKSNKATAASLGVSEKTVETHRLRLMNKMGVKSLAELVRMTLRLQEFRNGGVFAQAMRQAAQSKPRKA